MILGSSLKWLKGLLYGGNIVEQGSVETIFENSLHPYTEGLLMSIPSIDQNQEKLHVIKGSVPHPLQMPVGCAFHPRCPYAENICREKAPELTEA